MRTILLTALVLALLAPAASAQVPTHAPSATSVKLQAMDGALSPDQTFVGKGTVSYSYHTLGQTAMTSTRVTLKVAEAPSWAVVHLSPSTLHFPVSLTLQPGTTVHAMPQDFSLVVALDPSAPPGAVATVRIVAVADPNQPIGASAGEDGVLVKVSSDACHHAAAADEVVLEEKSANDVTTQSIGTTPAASVALPVSVLGLAGAGAGAAVAWRRRP